MSCLFKDSCKDYKYECEAKLFMACPQYHVNSMISFTRKFQSTFSQHRLASPVIPKNYTTQQAPVYAYTPQPLFNAILAEFRVLNKYSYSFMLISDLVTKAMAEEQIPESLLVVYSDYRAVSDAFVTPLVESCMWAAVTNKKPVFVLLPAGFIPPTSWVSAAIFK